LENRKIAFIILMGIVVGFLISFSSIVVIVFAELRWVVYGSYVPDALTFLSNWLFWFVSVTGLGFVIYVLWNLKNKMDSKNDLGFGQDSTS